jgi:tRNA A37 threonylcarbamoyladenosine modification protein TsaB
MGLKIFINTTVPKVAVVSLIGDKEKIVAQEKAEEPLEAIVKILKKKNLSLKDIESFSSHPGPGSFTGLRIGSSVTQALNFALGKKVKQEEINYE